MRELGMEGPLGGPSLTPSEVGERAEAIVLAELVKRGYRPLLPFGNSRRYDFVLDTEAGFVRAQVKSGRLADGVIEFGAASTLKAWASKSTSRRDYRGDVDVFLVYCPQTERIYWVPVGDVGTSKGYLRVGPTANAQRRGIRWAADYELSEANERSI